MEEGRRESRRIRCKGCGDEQEWLLVGKYPNGIKKWRDEKGLTCNGKYCGACNRDRVKATMKKTRAARKNFDTNADDFVVPF